MLLRVYIHVRSIYIGYSVLCSARNAPPDTGDNKNWMDIGDAKHMEPALLFIGETLALKLGFENFPVAQGVSGRGF